MFLLFIIAFLAWLTFLMQPLFRLQKNIFPTFSTTVYLLTNGTASNCKFLMSTGRASDRRSSSFQTQLQSSFIYLEWFFLTLVFIYTDNKFAVFHWYLRDKYIVPLPSKVIAGIPPLQPFCITSTCWYIALSESYRVQIISSVSKNPLENS